MRHHFTPAFVTLAALLILSGCATHRELVVDPPKSLATPLKALPGSTRVDGDDYYVQLVSEFERLGETNHRSGCGDLGNTYSKGESTSLLSLQIRNEGLGFARETPALAFQSSAGRCNSSLDAKRIYLTPWMRLDFAADTRIDYSFVSRASESVDVHKIGADVNLASNVLAFTGVGTGVALVGKLASGWMMNTAPAQTAEPAAESPAERRRESRSLPAPVSASGSESNLTRSVFQVLELADSKLNPLSGSPEPVGELRVYGDTRLSLLLKTGANGLPDARDLSLDELWRSQIRSGQGLVALKQFIIDAKHPEQPNLEPDWNNYRDVEIACRKLKVTMKDLGFNKYDRNALLYYFLDHHPEWRNYNVSAAAVMAGEVDAAQLRNYRNRGFGGCLIADDYEAMKATGLNVNGPGDWTAMLRSSQEKESTFAAIDAVERPFTAAIRSHDAGEMERQLFPQISRGGVSGKVLLQNFLGNFGLEQIIGTPPIPGEGVIIGAGPLAQLFAALKLAELSCARPAFEQGHPLPNVAILAFTTAADSPLSKGGALEFEFETGRIQRIALQSPMLRDFKQDALAHPDIGDCRIEPALLDKL